MHTFSKYNNPCEQRFSSCCLNFLVCLLIGVSFICCMPEEDLPIRNVGETPEYFIECYCKPGLTFALSATSVLPVSENLQVDFSKEMTVKILADREVELYHMIYTLPGSEFVYNYGSTERFISHGLDSLKLSIITSDQKQITASTAVPPSISIYDYEIEGNEATVRFYTSNTPQDNYYIYTAEIFRNDSILEKGACYLDYSEYTQSGLIEKSLFLTRINQAEKIVLNLKRITQANYNYQISLNAANAANQSSITTPVPLKGNLNGALGIFTCYTEDRKEIRNF